MPERGSFISTVGILTRVFSMSVNLIGLKNSCYLILLMLRRFFPLATMRPRIRLLAAADNAGTMGFYYVLEIVRLGWPVLSETSE